MNVVPISRLVMAAALAAVSPSPGAAAQTPGAAAATTPGAELPDPDSIRDLYAHCIEVAERTRRSVPSHPKPIFDLGHVHRRFGFDDRAIEAYEEGLRRDPRHPEIFERIGFLLSQKNRMQEAIEAYRAALALDPALGGPRTRIGLNLAHLGKTDEALIHYRGDVANGSAGAETHYYLGQALLDSKQFAAALASFEECLKLDRGHENAQYGLYQANRGLGRDAEAQAALARFQEIKQSRYGDYVDRSEEKSNRAHERRSAAETYLDAGETHLAAKQDAVARYCFEAALRFDPKSADARFILADLLRQSGDAARALREVEQAVSDDPHHVRSLHLLAGLYKESQRLAECAAMLERVIALAPRDADSHCELALALLQGKLRGPDSAALALSYAQKAVELKRSARHLDVLAFALNANGRRAEAIGALEEAVKLAPGDAALRQRLERVKR
jgi:tetratricopeptide (TPR) repeat protein